MQSASSGRRESVYEGLFFLAHLQLAYYIYFVLDPIVIISVRTHEVILNHATTIMKITMK